MTSCTIELLSIRILVADVRFVLLRIKEHVVVRALRKIPLRRSRAKPVLRLVTDVARCERPRSELRDVTFNAGLVSRKRKPQPLISIGIRDYRLQFRRTRMTRIAYLTADRLMSVGRSTT